MVVATSLRAGRPGSRDVVLRSESGAVPDLGCWSAEAPDITFKMTDADHDRYLASIELPSATTD